MRSPSSTLNCCQMAALEIRLDAVDRRDIPRGSVRHQHRRAELRLDVRRDLPRPVGADLQVAGTEHRSVHRVINDQRNGRMIRALEANDAELPVDRPIGIQSQINFAIRAARPPIDIRERNAGAHRDRCGREFPARFFDPVDERSGDLRGVAGIGIVRVTVGHERPRQPRRPQLGRRMGMRRHPPDALRFDPRFPRELTAEFVIKRRRE